jgi:glucose-1-phosphate cytidylyltransferase
VKVVLFCGGLGMRLRDHPENVPKPMVTIGYRPILWHLMKYYAHFGHKDFVLCLGHRGDAIKHYFLNYEECVTNDFVLSEGGRRRELLSSDIEDWRITFVDTGLNSSIGERLRAVELHLAGEEMFLANYADGLTDLPLPEQIEHFTKLDKIASFLSVRPNLSYHAVTTDERGLVTGLEDIVECGVRVNGGFFIFRPDVFRYLREGEELVLEPFQRLIREQQLVAYRYDGFWLAVDTAKDKKRVDDLFATGKPPWEVWNAAGARKGR